MPKVLSRLDSIAYIYRLCRECSPFFSAVPISRGSRCETVFLAPPCARACPRTPARRPGRPPRPRHATQPRPRTRSTRSRAPPPSQQSHRPYVSFRTQPPPASEPPRPRRHAGALCLRPVPVARFLPLRLCMCTFSIVIKGSLSKPLSLKRNVVLLCSAGCVLSLRHTGGAYLA